MEKTNLLKFMLVGITFFSACTALAAPTVDSVIVQGYMKKADGSAVDSTITYDLDVGVVQGTTTIWAKHFTGLQVTNGLFEVTLKGLGDNIGTGSVFNPVANSGDFSAVNFTPA